MTNWVCALTVTVIAILWLAGFHIKHKPTADQLFGCSWEQTDAATGECR
jgi:hypothetical protein